MNKIETGLLVCDIGGQTYHFGVARVNLRKEMSELWLVEVFRPNQVYAGIATRRKWRLAYSGSGL